MVDGKRSVTAGCEQDAAGPCRRGIGLTRENVFRTATPVVSLLSGLVILTLSSTREKPRIVTRLNARCAARCLLGRWKPDKSDITGATGNSSYTEIVTHLDICDMSSGFAGPRRGARLLELMVLGSCPSPRHLPVAPASPEPAPLPAPPGLGPHLRACR